MNTKELHEKLTAIHAIAVLWEIPARAHLRSVTQSEWKSRRLLSIGTRLEKLLKELDYDHAGSGDGISGEGKE